MWRFARKALVASCALLSLGVYPTITNAELHLSGDSGHGGGVITPKLLSSWYDNDWAYRAAITAKPGLIAGTSHTDMSLCLLIDGTTTTLSDVFTTALPDGSDIVITAADGLTPLGHEVVSFDPVGETAEIWFNTGTLSDTQNVFYVYWGNPLASPPTPGAAWTADHLVVYHFEDDPLGGTLTDSSPNANDGVVGSGSDWTSSGLTAGAIGQGWKLDGLTNWMWNETVSSSEMSFTISAWFSNSDLQDEGMLAFQSQTGFWDLSFLRTTGSPSPELRTSSAAGRWTPDILDVDQHHFVWSLDAAADTARFFLDGVEQTIVGRFPPTGLLFTGELIGGRIGIGGPVFFNVPDLSQGILDEYCIAEGARDSDWILTQYNNQSDPMFFFLYAGLETMNSTPVGIVNNGLIQIMAWPNPFQGASGLSIGLTESASNVKVYDVAGRLVRVLPAGPGLLSLTWDGRDARGLEVGSGIYYLRASSGQQTAATKVLLVR